MKNIQKLPRIPISECHDKHLYQLTSRNLNIGVFNTTNNGFIGIRTKLGNQRLDTEYHHDTEYGTAHPKTDLGPCPIKNISEGSFSESKFTQNKELFDWLKQQEKTNKE